MRIEETGKITEGFYVTGSPAVPVYLLDGPKPALFDAGLTIFARLYEKDIKEVLGDREPAYLFLTHSHFDHVGAAGYFKDIWPELQILGSARCREILRRAKAIELIREFNIEAANTLISSDMTDIHEEPFKAFDVDIIIKPDQVIKLGPGLTVEAINTPGHTWDFMSYWIPKRKILIGSEALGCYEGHGYIQTEFLVDYDTYLDSLRCLAELDAEILCPGHHALFTGADAKEHIKGSFKASKDFRRLVEDFLIKEKGDIDRTVDRVKAVEWDKRSWPKQPETAYLLNTRHRVQKIWERMVNNRGQGGTAG